jgi:hypothetical protein
VFELPIFFCELSNRNILGSMVSPQKEVAATLRLTVTDLINRVRTHTYCVRIHLLELSCF